MSVSVALSQTPTEYATPWIQAIAIQWCAYSLAILGYSAVLYCLVRETHVNKLSGVVCEIRPRVEPATC